MARSGSWLNTVVQETSGTHVARLVSLCCGGHESGGTHVTLPANLGGAHIANTEEPLNAVQEWVEHMYT